MLIDAVRSLDSKIEEISGRVASHAGHRPCGIGNAHPSYAGLFVPYHVGLGERELRIDTTDHTKAVIHYVAGLQALGKRAAYAREAHEPLILRFEGLVDEIVREMARSAMQDDITVSLTIDKTKIGFRQDIQGPDALDASDMAHIQMLRYAKGTSLSVYAVTPIAPCSPAIQRFKLVA